MIEVANRPTQNYRIWIRQLYAHCCSSCILPRDSRRGCAIPCKSTGTEQQLQKQMPPRIGPEETCNQRVSARGGLHGTLSSRTPGRRRTVGSSPSPRSRRFTRIWAAAEIQRGGREGGSHPSNSKEEGRGREGDDGKRKEGDEGRRRKGASRMKRGSRRNDLHRCTT